jgi:hypothetical protein
MYRKDKAEVHPDDFLSMKIAEISEYRRGKLYISFGRKLQSNKDNSLKKKTRVPLWHISPHGYTEIHVRVNSCFWWTLECQNLQPDAFFVWA